MCMPGYDSFPWMQFYLLIISQTHKVKPYIWAPAEAHSCWKVYFMHWRAYAVMESAHGEWVGKSWLCKPNPPLGYNCLSLSLLPSDLVSFAPSTDSHQRAAARNKRRHVRIERRDWICPRWTEHRTFKRAGSCVLSALEAGVTIYQSERRIQTDLSAAGEIEVDEILAAFSCDQVHKAFIFESVAVG